MYQNSLPRATPGTFSCSACTVSGGSGRLSKIQARSPVFFAVVGTHLLRECSRQHGLSSCKLSRLARSQCEYHTFYFVALLRHFSQAPPRFTPALSAACLYVYTHTGSLLVLSTAAVISAANPPRWQPQPIEGILVRGGANAREDGPYSFSLTTFSPRGSLTQIEYAINSAQVRVPNEFVPICGVATER